MRVVLARNSPLAAELEDNSAWNDYTGRGFVMFLQTPRPRLFSLHKLLRILEIHSKFISWFM